MKSNLGHTAFFYKFDGEHSEPMVALVCADHGEDCVNLLVIGERGNVISQLDVPLVHGGEAPECDFCSLELFQEKPEKKAAKKHKK